MPRSCKPPLQQEGADMRFVRAMRNKQAAVQHPTLVGIFKDPAKKADLFRDWFKANGNMEALELIIKKKMRNVQDASKKFRKMTKADLMTRFHNDEAYVLKVMADCKKKNRVTRDPIAPEDDDKVKYWILDEEAVVLHRELSEEVALEQRVEIEDAAEASAISDSLGSTGTFGGMGGFSDFGDFAMGDVDAAIADEGADAGWWEWTEPAGKGQTGKGQKGKGKKGHKGQKGKKGKGDAPGKGGDGAAAGAAGKGAGEGGGGAPEAGGGAPPGGNTGDPLKATDKVKEAKTLLSKVSTAVGACRKQTITVRLLNVNDQLADQLEKIGNALESVYKQSFGMVSQNKVHEPQYQVLEGKATKMLELWEKKNQFAKAILNVKKRQDGIAKSLEPRFCLSQSPSNLPLHLRPERVRGDEWNKEGRHGRGRGRRRR